MTTQHRLSTSQEYPVRFAARVIAAVTLLAGAWPIVARAFGWIDWDAAQTDAYIIAANAIIGAAGIVMGIQVEKITTPSANPKTDAGTALVPSQPPPPSDI